MMDSLKNLVEMRNRMDRVMLVDKEHDINEYLNHLRDSIGSNLTSEKYLTELELCHERVSQDITRMRYQMALQKDYYQSMIDAYHDRYYDRGEEVYKSMQNDTPEYIFDRANNCPLLENDDVQNWFFGRLGLYTSWKTPGICIHPLNGEVADKIKSQDPLYLVDNHEKMLFNVRTRWHEKYQKRLRYYTFNEEKENPLDMLPENQYGLIVSLGYFNYKPKRIIESFARNVYNLLRDGGVYIFTYNNCDLAKGVERVDQFFCTYMPRTHLETMLTEIGFQIIKSVDATSVTQWIEVKKPGLLQSLRGGQTLAMINGLYEKQDPDNAGVTFPPDPRNGQLFTKSNTIPPQVFRYSDADKRWHELGDDEL